MDALWYTHQAQTGRAPHYQESSGLSGFQCVTAELSTCNAEEGMIRYTVRHCDTHEPLFRGDGQGREKVRGIIGTLSKARLSGRLVEFVPSEWYVTGWDHDRLDPYGLPEIVGSVSATEFMDDPRALEG